MFPINTEGLFWFELHIISNPCTQNNIQESFIWNLLVSMKDMLLFLLRWQEARGGAQMKIFEHNTTSFILFYEKT